MVAGLEIRYYLYYIYGNCNNILYINECLEKRVFTCIYMGKSLRETYNGGLSQSSFLQTVCVEFCLLRILCN